MLKLSLVNNISWFSNFCTRDQSFIRYLSYPNLLYYANDIETHHIIIALCVKDMMLHV